MVKKNKNKKKRYDKDVFVSIIPLALFIIGSYVLVWGLFGTANINIILRTPIFWGLILILSGFLVLKKIK